MDDIKMEDIRQTREWARYLRNCGWVVERVDNVYVFIRRIPLTPLSIMKVQRFVKKIDFRDLKKLRRKYRVIYTVVEPSEEESFETSFSGWRVNRHPFLPTKTVVVDLKKSERELWNDLSVNAKRILGEKKIIRMIELELEEKNRFYKEWRRAAKTWIMSAKQFDCLLEAFGKKARLVVSELGGEWLSGILLLESGNTANYFQTWTNKNGRRLGGHYYLIWQTILSSKQRGLNWFDFEGILDKRWPQKRWAGFSNFKKKFGGKEVVYPGSFWG